MAAGRIIRTCSLLALALLATTPASADAGDLAAYLRARVAESGGQDADAVAGYARALADAPANPVIAIRAYRTALAAGDAPLARRAATALIAAGVAPDDAALWPLVDAARAEDPAAAERSLAALGTGRLKILIPALRAWIAAARGQDMPAIEAPKDDAVGRRLINETRVLLTIATGRVVEGTAAAEALRSTTPSGFQIAAAELLIGGGHDDAASRMLDNRAGLIAAARAGATARPTLAFGVSRLLLRLADDLGGDRPSTLGLAFARAALDADPDYARARLILAEQLALTDEPDRALEQLALVPADGPLGATAAGRRINLLDAEDRAADALAVARLRAGAKDATTVDRARYADLLVAADRPADALPFYVAITKDRDAAKNWATWLRYGAALDQAGRWKDARKALRRAADLGPDQPSALNYLGYALVEHGEDVPAATRMLERAHSLATNDASIADSLGWAYHRDGQTQRGLSLIERAAADEPANAEISEHLGDAYWTLGRRYEARYAWAAAAVTAEPPAAARLATKQESGL